MTVICGGGTSSAKSGFGASVAFTASGIAALLNNIPTPWAVPLAAYIGLITYDLASYCGTDPPPVPVMSAPDWINVISIADPVAHLLAVLKMQQLVGAFAWYSLCQCDSVATPAPPAAPAAPASVPNVNPPAVTGPSPLAACFQWDLGNFSWTTPSGGVQFGQTQVGPAGTVSLLAAPSGATYVRVTITWTGTSSPLGANILSNTSNTVTGATQRAVLDATWTSGVSRQMTFQGTLDAFWFVTVSKGDTAQQTYRVQWEFFCGGTPTTPATNCLCVPDANTIGLLSSIYQTLTTVQRFKFPFAYVLGTQHTGVSGTGATVISRLIGVQLTVTAQPATKRTSLGNPSYIYDLGWVSVSDADGMIEEKRLTRTSMLWFPQLGQLATSFNYFLQSGVTITWTEVQAEPGVTAA